MGTAADGMHPTGMHSCWILCVLGNGAVSGCHTGFQFPIEKVASCIFCLRVHFANAISCRRMELFTECMNPHRSACDTQFYRLVQYSSLEKMGQYICEDKAGEGTMLIFPCLGTKLAHSLKTIKLCHSAGRALTCDWSVHSLPMFVEINFSHDLHGKV